MSAPSLIVDASLSLSGNYFVIEEDAIWATYNLAEAGAATWEKVFDAATDFSGATWQAFTRVLCANKENLVYGLGFAQKSSQSGSESTAYIFVSTNEGETWSYYEIGALEFTFGNGMTYVSKACTGGTESHCVATFWGSGGNAVCQAVFDGGATFQWTECFGKYDLPEDLDPGHIYTLEYDAIGDFPSDNYDALGDCPPYIHYLVSSPIVEGAFAAVSGGYHFTGTINTDRMPDRGQLKIGWFYGYPGRWDVSTAATRVCTVMNLTINGVEYTNLPPAGFDASKTNPLWLYVGLPTKIVASEDGGATWFDFYTVHGANDICVDPQAAGAIYYWSTAGRLNLLIKQVVGGTEEGILTSSNLMTETPLEVFGRVARDPSSGVLLGIPNGTVLTRRMNGANEDIGTGYTNACGLNVYAGQKIIFVDAYDVWISDDIQAAMPTITAKKGGWAAYGNGVQSHRMLE